MTLIEKDPPLIFYKNYDLYNTEGLDGKPKNGPGKGLYSDMDKYKSVSSFRKRKRKKSIKKRQAQLLEIFLITAEKDNNDLTDPTEEEITPIPYAPAEPAPIGIIDGASMEKEDFEGKPLGSLYYGVMETHFSDDGKMKNK